MNNKFKIKYGFNVNNQKPEDQFEYASSNGLHHIEINLSRNKLSDKIFNSEEINKLKDLSKAHNVRVSFHIPYYLNIAEILLPLRKTNINYLLKCIQVASELKATHLTLHVGNFYWFPVEPWMRKKALNRFVKSLRKILKVCEEKNVIIALENVVPIPNGSEYYLLGDNVEDFKYIFSRLDSKYLKFCLDTGHANMGEGVIEYINNFHDKLCCIHYHDNNGFNDDHLPIGKGKVPWEDLAEELINIKYQGPIISECRNIEAHESAILFDKYFEKILSDQNQN
ncbi:MAG: sugar phosphate isomerase/epimerase [Ignavibacteriae bacterium]|nr:sugar phosphate isomerase/epimerase [Ignavibacteriota bacterium]